jgi:hypothetical protein
MFNVIVDEKMPKDAILVMGPVEVRDAAIELSGTSMRVSGKIDWKQAMERSVLIQGLGQD